jgi:hypothetical protein
MVFVITMALHAALYQLWDLFTGGQYLLVAVDVVIIIMTIFVVLEATSAFTREKNAAARVS